MPQRHSKNAGVMGSETLSYAERKAMGYGTVKERFGKVSLSNLTSVYLATATMVLADRWCWDRCSQDTLGNYDDCCLTLQEAVVGSWLQTMTLFFSTRKGSNEPRGWCSWQSLSVMVLLPARTQS
jgi:hypothetical protein